MCAMLFYFNDRTVALEFKNSALMVTDTNANAIAIVTTISICRGSSSFHGFVISGASYDTLDLDNPNRHATSFVYTEIS